MLSFANFNTFNYFIYSLEMGTRLGEPIKKILTKKTVD